MPEVRFHRVDRPELIKAICRAATEAFEQGERVLVFAEDPEQAEVLNKALWTWKQDCFVPHIWDAPGSNDPVEKAPLMPVVIVHEERNPNKATVLVGAAMPTKDFGLGFSAVHDFAETYDENRRRAGRARFAAWREWGCEPEMVAEGEGR